MPLRLTAQTPRRVFITADAVGGVWQYTVDLLRGLSTRQIETVLAVLGPSPTPAQCSAAQTAGASELHITGMPLDWTAPTQSAFAETCCALAEMAGCSGADIAHLHAPAFASAGTWRTSVVATAHSCVTTWWEAVKSGPLPLDLQWRSEATGRGLRCCSAVIVPSASFAAALCGAYGTDLSTYVIHNGRTPAPAGEASERQHFVLSAGRVWDEGKNFRVLNECAVRLNVPVLVAGATVGPNGAKAEFPHLRLLGPVTEAALKVLYGQAGVFVSPSRYEPFGLAILEAAAVGMPLVLSDIPTFRELWDGAAIFCAADDAGAFAAAIRRSLDDPAASARLGSAARARARKYTSAAMTGHVLDLYRSLLPQIAGRAA